MKLLRALIAILSFFFCSTFVAFYAFIKQKKETSDKKKRLIKRRLVTEINQSQIASLQHLAGSLLHNFELS